MASSDLQQIIEENLGDVPATFIYAFLELVLIILLFLDGLISFAANEFAHFFGLKIPCLLCTRIDHSLFRRDPDFFYKQSICQEHRKEVSSIGYCHVHMNASDVRKMCPNCLLSFAAEKKASAETYRSLVAILGAKLEISVDGDRKIHLKFPVTEEEDQTDGKKRIVHQCSCCGERLRTSVLSDGWQAPEIPVPSVPIGRESLTVKRKGPRCSRPSSHVSFMEVRIASDAESDGATDDNVSLIFENDSDVDEVISKRKFAECLDGFMCEDAAVEHHKARDGSIWHGLDVKEGSLKHGLEELTWDNDVLLHPSECGPLAAEDHGKSRTGRTTRIMYRSKSDIKEAEFIEFHEAFKTAMANKLYRTNDNSSTDASKASAEHNAVALPIIRKRLSYAIDKSLEPLKGGSMTNWKILLQTLQRRVHLDRKSLIALSAELDQERNASAIAANQAMAMITRLQEEKAAVVMEALHYRRLMEEQVEYDQEALQVMRDLLSKREKKIRALEAELETYRERFHIEVERYGESEDDSCAEMRWKDWEDYKVQSDMIDSS